MSTRPPQQWNEPTPVDPEKERAHNLAAGEMYDRSRTLDDPELIEMEAEPDQPCSTDAQDPDRAYGDGGPRHGYRPHSSY